MQVNSVEWAEGGYPIITVTPSHEKGLFMSDHEGRTRYSDVATIYDIAFEDARRIQDESSDSSEILEKYIRPAKQGAFMGAMYIMNCTVLLEAPDVDVEDPEANRCTSDILFEFVPFR